MTLDLWSCYLCLPKDRITDLHNLASLLNAGAPSQGLVHTEQIPSPGVLTLIQIWLPTAIHTSSLELFPYRLLLTCHGFLLSDVTPVTKSRNVILNSLSSPSSDFSPNSFKMYFPSALQHVYKYTVWVPGAHRDQKRASDSSILQSWIVSYKPLYGYWELNPGLL